MCTDYDEYYIELAGLDPGGDLRCGECGRITTPDERDFTYAILPSDVPDRLAAYDTRTGWPIAVGAPALPQVDDRDLYWGPADPAQEWCDNVTAFIKALTFAVLPADRQRSAWQRYYGHSLDAWGLRDEVSDNQWIPPSAAHLVKPEQLVACIQCVEARRWLQKVCSGWGVGALADELNEHASEGYNCRSFALLCSHLGRGWKLKGSDQVMLPAEVRRLVDAALRHAERIGGLAA